MDIISSINSAFTQIHRNEQMSVSSGTGHTRNQVQHRESESRSHSFGQIGGGHNHRPESTVDGLRSAIHNAVSYDRSERGGIQLRTQEGDVVRLKFLNTESSNALGQQFENGGNLIANFSLEGGNSSNFQVVVEGDLNGQELSAIRDVLIQAREMANTFYDGDVKTAFELASNFEIDSEQLANVNMRLSVQETYTYARSVVEAQNTQNPAVVSPDDQILPISPAVDSAPPVAPVSTPPQLADVTAPASQPDLAAVAPVNGEPQTTGVTPVIAEVVPTPVHVEPDAVENLAGALSTITDFLNQLTESMNAFGQQFQNPGSQTSYSFSVGFQLQVVSALVGQMDPPSVEREFTGHSLAAATIDEMAAKMDAHVDDMV